VLICAQRQEACNNRIAWVLAPGHPGPMSEPASDAWLFYREVIASGFVWTLWDGENFPSQRNAAGQQSQAFWSSEARAKQVIALTPTLKSMKPYEISWADFTNHWAPGLNANGILAVLNWPGTGNAFYLGAADVVGAVEGMAGV
jgi:hypothetical protein